MTVQQAFDATEATFKTTDGLTIFYRHWQPAGAARSTTCAMSGGSVMEKSSGRPKSGLCCGGCDELEAQPHSAAARTRASLNFMGTS